MRTSLSPDPLASLVPATLSDTYARLRRDAPVHWSPNFGGWVLTRYADATQVLADPGFLADDPVARLMRIEQRGGPSLPNLRAVLSSVAFYTNPPRHAPLRRFISMLFRRLDTGALRERLEHRVGMVLESARGAGGLDLAADYGSSLASYVIHVLLGLSWENCVKLADIVRGVAWIFDATPHSLRELIRAEAEVGLLLDHFEHEIVERRRGTADDGFSLIVTLADSELALSDRDLAGFCTFFFVGILETSANGITACSLLFLLNEAARARLEAEPGNLPGATREFLRLAAPFQYVVRVAGRDCFVGGEAIGEGERVNIILGAANRDPAAFPDPDRIDPDRKGPESLAFGTGAYRCLGASLAQVETEVALAGLLAAPDLGLSPGTIVWQPQTRVPALARAWVTFGARRRTDEASS